MSHNELSNLAGIEDCVELRALVANDNRIAALDSLIKLVNLNSLILSRNYLQVSNDDEVHDCLFNSLDRT